MRPNCFHRSPWHSMFSPKTPDRSRRGSRHHHGSHGHHEHGHEHGHHRRHDVGDEHHAIKRLLAHGDLRFVVLLLIEEKPRHGYELIKLIEAKSSGQYAPSPGVIYPTLTYLEETGWVSTAVEAEKKQYAITAEGIEHLNRNREMATGILNRLEVIGAQIAAAKADPFEAEDGSEIKQAFHAIKVELKSSRSPSVATRKKMLEVLQRTLAEIQQIVRNDAQ